MCLQGLPCESACHKWAEKQGSVAQSVEQRPFKPFVAGSIPTQDISVKNIRGVYLSQFGSVAQLVEQRPFKPFVAGSIPAGPTKKNVDPCGQHSFWFVRGGDRRARTKHELIHVLYGPGFRGRREPAPKARASDGGERIPTRPTKN